jgi:glycosyltransferase involved in cell wall biosynthesis
MNGQVAPDRWATLLAEAAGDERIRVIDETWTRERLLALMQTADAYVSLHRSEGFGRTPAEAMLLGKPVIVTDYSGTTDFCRDDNALLVDCRLVAVEHGSYVAAAAGQVWADPSIESAARHMQALFRDRTLGPRVGSSGRRTILEEFSADAVGRLYRDRLVQLGIIDRGE